MSLRGSKRVLVFVAGAAVLAASCGPPGALLPPRPAAVPVTMNEFRFEYSKSIPRGRVIFEAINAGKLEHRMTLVPLPDDFPPVDVQRRNRDPEKSRTIDPVATSTPVPPGGRASFAVNLGPYRYALFCLLAEEDGKSHYRAGMVSEFKVL